MADYNTVPIIKLEVERMRYAMRAALTEHITQIDESIVKALDAFCTPDNLDRIIQAETDRVLTEIIKTEVNNFYRYGGGREVIKEEVIKKLTTNKTYTPLDDVKGDEPEGV